MTAGQAGEDFARSAAPKKKVAVLLKDAETVESVFQKVRDFCTDNGFEVVVLDNTEANHLKASELVQQDSRLKSVCYIAGAAEGNDPELSERVVELAEAVADAGYNTVYPGSAKGQMGVLADAIIKKGKPITSVFSFDVAHAHIEELDARVSSIVVAPNEKVRQKLYHLLSGAQIARPGGTGTKTEGAIHYYQNTKIGLIYRHPDFFGPENYPSPIIYFSPRTAAVEAEYKKLLCEKFYPDDKDMQGAIMGRPLMAGYWDFEALSYSNIVDMGFEKRDYMAFVRCLPTADEVVDQLDIWNDPKMRQMLVDKVNEHFAASRVKLGKVETHDLT